MIVLIVIVLYVFMLQIMVNIFSFDDALFIGYSLFEVLIYNITRVHYFGK